MAAVAGLAPRPAGAQPVALSATEIFDRTRAVVARRVEPPFIAYTQYAAFVRRGRTRDQTDRVILRLDDGKARITPAGSPDSAAHVDDRPLVFPTSTFGLVTRARGEAASTFEPADPAGPAVIGHVNAVARAYDVALAGTEQLEGVPVYHLVLTPRFDPRRNRIRALFVDTSTFDPRRIVIEYYAQRGPLRSRPTVSFDYTRVGDTWLITRASMDFVVRFGFFAYGGAGELKISDVTFPSAEPDELFTRDPHAK